MYTGERKEVKMVGRIMQNIEIDIHDYNGVPHVRLVQNTNAIHLHPAQLDLVMQWMGEVKDDIDNRKESIIQYDNPMR